jgi:hypothetical protein
MGSLTASDDFHTHTHARLAAINTGFDIIVWRETQNTEGFNKLAWVFEGCSAIREWEPRKVVVLVSISIFGGFDNVNAIFAVAIDSIVSICAYSHFLLLLSGEVRPFGLLLS